MAVTITVQHSCELPNGARQIDGTVTFDSSYPAGGEVFDISAYLSGSPNVRCSGDDGYEIQHDRGTAAAGKLLAYEAGADTAPLDEVTATTDLSAVICYFQAVGTAV